MIAGRPARKMPVRTHPPLVGDEEVPLHCGRCAIGGPESGTPWLLGSRPRRDRPRLTDSRTRLSVHYTCLLGVGTGGSTRVGYPVMHFGLTPLTRALERHTTSHVAVQAPTEAGSVLAGVPHPQPSQTNSSLIA